MQEPKRSVASLPMYDLPEARRETDAWWALLASHMRRAGVQGVPDRLNRARPYEAIWSSRDLLISQTCGYPLMTRYQEILRPVGTLHYGVDGCSGADYSSVILTPAGSDVRDVADLRGKVCVVNSAQSHSGYNALRARIAPLSKGRRYFSEVKLSGGHRQSVRALVCGQADVCAVDCVSFALLARYAPESLAGVRVLEFTERCPGLPLVVRKARPADEFDRMRAALREAVVDPAGTDVREALFIEGMTETETRDYQPILDMKAGADAAGYGEIH